MSNIDELFSIINYCGIQDIINLLYSNTILYKILIDDKLWSMILLRDYKLKSEHIFSKKKYVEQHMKKLKINRYIITKLSNKYVIDNDSIEYLAEYILCKNLDENYIPTLDYIIGLIEDYNVIFHTDLTIISKNIIEDILSDIGYVDRDYLDKI